MKLSEKDIYRRRFMEDITFRNDMWKILCKHHFQQFIDPESTVLEIAAGYCEFINHIQSRRKIAIDVNEDTKEYANDDVQVHLTPSTDLSCIEAGTIDNVFTSNFFEHISRDEIAGTVRECHRVLKSGGQILILQPNIRYAYKDYWMFFDHVTPVDDRALAELLEVVGFEMVVQRPRFLPYTTKSRLPRALFLIKAYLALPFLHRFFGGQAFLVARKR